jgi:hypothetical protein
MLGPIRATPPGRAASPHQDLPASPIGHHHGRRTRGLHQQDERRPVRSVVMVCVPALRRVLEKAHAALDPFDRGATVSKPSQQHRMPLIQT